MSFIDKNLLRKNLLLIKEKNQALVSKLIDSLPQIEKNLSVVPKENSFDILYKGQLIPDIKKRADNKIKNLEQSIGVVYQYLSPEIDGKSLEKYKQKEIAKEDLIYNTHSLLVLGTNPFFHISELLSKKDKYFPYLKEVVIYEPTIEFLYLFLSTIDIEEVVKKGEIDFIILASENKLDEYIRVFFRFSPFSSYLVSYENENIRKIKSKIEDLYKKAKVGITYQMALDRVLNTKGMLKLETVRHLLKSKKNKNKSLNKVPFVIVGSGPSLDESIPYLKQIQNKSVIVALSTATKTLIENGIIPDFVSIVDAHRDMDRFLEGINEDILKKISVFSYIGTSVSFNSKFRESLVFYYTSIRNLLNIRDEVAIDSIEGTTVLDSTFELLIFLGAEKILLFGVDLGSKYEDRFHTVGYKNKEIDRKVLAEADITVEGNFGGIVKTRSDYYVSKVILENKIKNFKKQGKSLKIYNLSDGAKIEGTIPYKPEDINQLLSAKIPKKQINKKIRSTFVKRNVYILPQEIQFLRKKILPAITSFKEKVKKEKDSDKIIDTLTFFLTWAKRQGYYTDLIFNNLRSVDVYTIIHLYSLIKDEEEKNEFISNFKDSIINIFKDFEILVKELIN